MKRMMLAALVASGCLYPMVSVAQQAEVPAREEGMLEGIGRQVDGLFESTQTRYQREQREQADREFREQLEREARERELLRRREAALRERERAVTRQEKTPGHRAEARSSRAPDSTASALPPKGGERPAEHFGAPGASAGSPGAVGMPTAQLPDK